MAFISFQYTYTHSYIHSSREPSSARFYERLQTAWYCSFPSLFRAFLHPLCSLLASVRSSRFLSGFTTTWRMLIRLISCEKCNSRTTSQRLFVCSLKRLYSYRENFLGQFYYICLIFIRLVFSCCWILMEIIVFFVSFLFFFFFFYNVPLLFYCNLTSINLCRLFCSFFFLPISIITFFNVFKYLHFSCIFDFIDVQYCNIKVLHNYYYWYYSLCVSISVVCS